MHIGHKAVIEKASSCSLALSVFTFFSKDGKRGEKPLISPEEKLKLFETLSVKYCFMPDFSVIKNISGKDFFEKILVNKMSAKTVVCGEDFRFGVNAECGVNELGEFCKEFSVNLIVVPLVKLNGVKVSTTEIRKLIDNGETEKANSYLGI